MLFTLQFYEACDNSKREQIAYNESMFVHLRLHTEFSVVDGTNRVDDIVKAAAADGQPALAMTDLNNLFGAIKFYKEGRGKGVKPLIGCDVVVEPLGAEASPTHRLILLVMNHQGYLNLCELLARAWTQNVVRDQAVIKWSWLQERSAGLLALSGAQAGPLGAPLLQGDLIEVLDGVGTRRKVLIHINNTNPILNEDSAERAQLAKHGIEVAYDGMEIEL